MAPVNEVKLAGRTVRTWMGVRAYEAECDCGWVAVPHENWVLVSAAIVAHFNEHITPV